VAIPTALSTNAALTYKAAIWNSKGEKYSIHTGASELVFYDRVLWGHEAVERLNKSGLGDVVSAYSAIADWRLALTKEKDLEDLPFDQRQRAIERQWLLLWQTEGIYQRLVSAATKYGRRCGVLNELNIDLLVEISQMVMELGTIDSDLAGRPDASSEHQLAFAIERQLPRETRVLHGELVALSTIIIASLYSHFQQFFGEDLAVYGINNQRVEPEPVRHLTRQLGMPVTPYAINPLITQEILVKALQHMYRIVKT
jgi:glycerol dehydrogenase-like iron-containing ADH family enzyme